MRAAAAVPEDVAREAGVALAEAALARGFQERQRAMDVALEGFGDRAEGIGTLLPGAELELWLEAAGNRFVVGNASGDTQTIHRKKLPHSRQPHSADAIEQRLGGL